MRPGSLRARFEVFLWRHGWGWPLAALGCAFAAAAGLSLYLPARDALALASVPVPVPRTQPVAAPAADEATRLHALRTQLRTDADPTRLIRQLHALADAAQLKVAQSDYSQHVHPVTGLGQVVVVQPVRAPYAQVKRYIESVLREHANVSLDQIAARRENVGQTELEVRLRWTFWIDRTGAPVASMAPSAALKASP
jgi:hypothetical protein